MIGGKVDRPDLRRRPAAVERVTVDVRPNLATQPFRRDLAGVAAPVAICVRLGKGARRRADTFGYHQQIPDVRGAVTAIHDPASPREDSDAGQYRRDLMT